MTRTLIPWFRLVHNLNGNFSVCVIRARRVISTGWMPAIDARLLVDSMLAKHLLNSMHFHSFVLELLSTQMHLLDVSFFCYFSFHFSQNVLVFLISHFQDASRVKNSFEQDIWKFLFSHNHLKITLIFIYLMWNTTKMKEDCLMIFFFFLTFTIATRNRLVRMKFNDSLSFIVAPSSFKSFWVSWWFFNFTLQLRMYNTSMSRAYPSVHIKLYEDHVAKWNMSAHKNSIMARTHFFTKSSMT